MERNDADARTGRSRLYWSLQFAGWGLYFGLTAGFILQFAAPSRKPSFTLFWAFTMCAHLAASHVLRAAIRRYQWLDAKPLALGIRLLAACLVLAVIVQLLCAAVEPFLAETPLKQQLLDARFYAITSFFLLGLWSAFYLGFQYFFRYRDSEMRRLRLEVSLRDAELRALKTQINPHFLFNCLNNLRALIAEDTLKAREMITRLSELLRYALDAGQRDRVALDQELDIVRDYLELEKLQFEERLIWRIDADPAALNCLVPPMIVQQLAENAIKHGISQRKSGGQVIVSAHTNGTSLNLRVENTGQLRGATGGGLGLANARERLRFVCGSQAELQVENIDSERVAATARIPLTV